MYLDIGTSGGASGGGNSEQLEAKMSVTAQQYIYPLGIDFLDENAGLDSISNSASIKLSNGLTGDTSFVRNENTISVTAGNTAPVATYIKDGVTVKIGDTELTAVPIEETVYLRKMSQTTDGVTSVNIYKGSTESNANELIMSFTYTVGDSSVNIGYSLDMPDGDSNWRLKITTDVSVNVTEIGNSGFLIEINNTTVNGTGTITVN